MGFGKLLTRPGKLADLAEAAEHNRAAGAAFQVIIDGHPINDPGSIYSGGMSLPGAWRAVLMISDALGSVPWDLWREDRGERVEKVTPRPVLLEQPHPENDRMTTFSSWAMDLVWHGNAFGLIADRDSDGAVTAVLPIPAAQVGVRRIGWEAKSVLPTGPVEYQVGSRIFAPWEVVHIKGPCEPSEVRGFGVLEAHLSGVTGSGGGALDLARELQRQAQAIGQNGVPTGTLKSDNPDLTATEAELLKAKWLAAQRDRTIAVLNATTSFEALAWNPDELQLVEARKLSLLEQALIFGVQPSALAVEMSNRTYRNDNAEDVKFTKWGLRGHIARFEQTLSGCFPPGLVVKAELDDYTRPDPKTRAETDQIRILSRTLLPNEARAAEGRTPLPGGDEFPAPVAVDNNAPKENPSDDPDEDEPVEDPEGV